MKREIGFSLVELMVAMVIGLIIILGAGQLFMTVFQTGRQVELLSEKQAAVNFAVETLLRDIRRANPKSIKFESGSLELVVPNRGDVVGCSAGQDVTKTYFLSGNNLQLRLACGGVTIGPDSIVSAFDTGGFLVEPGNSDGEWVVSLGLLPSDSLVFHAVNRTAAVSN